MIWWIPWVVATLAWPLVYQIKPDPVLPTGIALVVYGAALTVVWSLAPNGN